MYSTEQYIKDTISFTNSLIVKFSGASVVINNGLLDTLGIVTDDNDKHTHKYYLNLAGIKHSTNNDVQIKILEDNKTYSLTKELLATNASTRNKLLLFKNYYKDLIDSYPDDIDYIRGCILPVDIDEAINAKDGTILAYSGTYVDYNELSLMRELNEYTQSFFVRWYIPEYLITDELYAASIVGSLVSTIPGVILNARLKRVKTNEVNKFHLEHYFRSRLDTWDEVSILSNETIIWLYNNLDTMIKNTGKQKTLDSIVNNILEPNGIGIGAYKLKDGGQAISNNVISRNSNYLKIEGLNSSYDIHNNEKVDLPTTTELQVVENNVIGIPKNNTGILDEYVNNKLGHNRTNSVNTKILDLDYGTIFKTYGGDTFLSTLDTLYRSGKNGTYVNVVPYVDPNSKKTYTINVLTGYYLIVYHMLSLAGIDANSVTTTYNTKSINYNITIDDLTANIHDIESFIDIAKAIHSYIPNDIHSLTTDSFNNLLSEIRNLYTKVWLLDSNVNNANISGAIKQMVNRLYVSSNDTIGTNGNLIDTLVENGVILDIGTSYDHVSSIETIFKLLTGNDLSDFVKYNNNNDIIKSLVNKLTSYTINIISSVNDAEPLYAPYSSIQAYNSNNGLINITKASTVSPYETNGFNVNGRGDDFKDGIRDFNRLSTPNIDFNTEQLIYAYSVMYDDVSVISTSPTMSCEIINSYKPYMSPELNVKGDNMDVTPKGDYNDNIFNKVKVTSVVPDIVAYDDSPDIDSVDTNNTPDIIVTID